MIISTTRRTAIAALGAGLSVGALAPLASAQTVADIKKKGEITIGMLVDFPPYGTTNAAEPARRLRRRRRQAAGQGLGREGQHRAGHRPEPHSLPADQQGRRAGGLAGRDARARQAGGLLAALCGRDHRALRQDQDAPSRAGRPEGRARRRGPRQHAGRGRDQGRARRHRDPPLRRRRLRHAGADVGPGRCDRLLDHRGRADRQARSRPTPSRTSSRWSSRCRASPCARARTSCSRP